MDVNGPHDLNLSVADAAAKVSGRTRAIMVVHYGGYPCDMDAIAALARRHGLKIIEDCAHAPGAVLPCRPGTPLAGTLGDVGCFSFFANKNLTTGEGGMVVTDDDELAEENQDGPLPRHDHPHLGPPPGSQLQLRRGGPGIQLPAG